MFEEKKRLNLREDSREEEEEEERIMAVVAVDDGTETKPPAVG